MCITDFKYCSACKSHKHRDEYYKNVRAKDGLQHWCKVCAKEAGKRYRRKCDQIRAALWGRA